jgi:enoyl-CoA hydratase
MTRVLTEVADGVATITLNDPGRRNALDLDFNEELFAAFDAIEADPGVGAVVITGAPPAFCAGADLSHLDQKGSREGLLAIYEGFMRVGRCPLPTIAAVGAGMNLALVCDLRLAARSARFDTRFLNLGIHPGGGHTWMFQRIAGPQTTFATVVFGQVLDGEGAERVGLVWRCVDDDQLLPTAQEMARNALNAPVDLVKKITATIRGIGKLDDHREAMMMELEPQAWSTEQPHFRDKVAALKKKISSR